MKDITFHHLPYKLFFNEHAEYIGEKLGCQWDRKTSAFAAFNQSIKGIVNRACIQSRMNGRSTIMDRDFFSILGNDTNEFSKIHVLNEFQIKKIARGGEHCRVSEKGLDSMKDVATDIIRKACDIAKLRGDNLIRAIDIAPFMGKDSWKVRV